VVVGSKSRCDGVERDDHLNGEAEACVRRRVEIRRSKNMFGISIQCAGAFLEVKGVADFGEAT
jgi:hypothetical protein